MSDKSITEFIIIIKRLIHNIFITDKHICANCKYHTTKDKYFSGDYCNYPKRISNTLDFVTGKKYAFLPSCAQYNNDGKCNKFEKPD